jgi:heme exporter protein B
MFRDALLVARKDLRVEWRSRVGLGQVVPFALLVLVLFGFALDAERPSLLRFAGGLFWVTVLLSTLLAVQRSFAIEAADGAMDGLRRSGIEPASVFLGKAAAVAVQLLVLELLLGIGIVVLYDARVEAPVLLVTAATAAAVGVAAAGTLYGALAAGTRARETILPILLLPVLAPVLIGATRAFGDALGVTAVDGWAWTGLLAAFAAAYVAFGTLAFGVLLEEW